MTNVTTHLPGVYFETQAPAAVGDLPRMDVVGFVGFSSRGPLDTPVAIESVDRFHEIFGERIILAWDRQQGTPVEGQLAPAVRAFFRNGGKRCWVVRVAGDQAHSNTFQIPGLLVAEDDRPLYGARIEARSEGSWSDRLTVNATLSATHIRVREAALTSPIPNGPPEIEAVIDRATPIKRGDLLKVTAADESLKDVELYIAVAGVRDAASTGSPPGRVTTMVELAAAHGFRRWSVTAVSPPAAPAVISAWPLSCVGGDSLTVLASEWAGATSGDPIDGQQWDLAVRVPQSEIRGVHRGAWLRLDLTGVGSPPAGSVLFLVAGERGDPDVGTLRSPPDDDDPVWLVGRVWSQLDDTQVRNALVKMLAGTFAIVTPHLELWVREAGATAERLRDLGFTPEHPRYMGGIPTDAELFALSKHPRDTRRTDLDAAVSNPRFPLSTSGSATTGTSTSRSGDGTGYVFLPLGVPGVLEPAFAQPRLMMTERAATGLPPHAEPSPIERDGLATLDAGVFLDPDLASVPAATLLSEAFYKQYQSAAGERRLTKLHALLDIEEVSTLALPDGHQWGWERSVHSPLSPLVPVLEAVPPRDTTGRYTVSWTPVPETRSYTVEEAADPRFEAPLGRWTVVGSTQRRELTRSDGCPPVLFYRVRADGAWGRGAWSNTERQQLPAPGFTSCDEPAVPTLSVDVVGGGRVKLWWEYDRANGEVATLEMAGDPQFSSPTIAYEGTETSHELWRLPRTTPYFRVAIRRAGVSSPWSMTVGLRPPPRELWVQKALDDTTRSAVAGRLATVHQAMLRFCTARGDVLACLSLPSYYREDETLEYIADLQVLVGSEGAGRPLTYGVLVHPWLALRDLVPASDRAVRHCPPDGTFCGSLAATTLTAGAWVSPANRPFSGVVALVPSWAADRQPHMYTKQVNEVRLEPRGFVVMSSQTLSLFSEYREITVRRLLILVRRLAVREGVTFVFRPNTGHFRRLVQRQFESVLADLFQRGAFAGATHREAFRVVTDDSVNFRQSLEQGRFVVELRIAASRPMAFITVRLVQRGSDLLLAEEL